MTTQELVGFFGGNTIRAARFFPHLVKYMPMFGIDTEKRVEAFMSQCAHESINFTKLQEDTNYKDPERLYNTFKRHFKNLEEAKQYAGRPVAIANRVYANRLGNGNEASGDGWKHRGAGIIQLTGKDWHRSLGKALFKDAEKFVKNPELLSTPEIAVMSACWFWKVNGLNKYADNGDFQGLTKKINGGLNGYKDRLSWWERAKRFFN